MNNVIEENVLIVPFGF